MTNSQAKHVASSNYPVERFVRLSDWVTVDPREVVGVTDDTRGAITLVLASGGHVEMRGTEHTIDTVTAALRGPVTTR